MLLHGRDRDRWLRGIREAGKAGSWYEGDPDVLSQELDGFLADVPASINDANVPISGARVIIAPHAGYSYSGPCAAWAYKCLDLSQAKRIFLLGPSHTYYLRGCALTKFAHYATPFGDLTVDKAVVRALLDTGKFQEIPTDNDLDEHSLEMHLPYLYKRITQTFTSWDQYPTLVPIMIGDNNGPEEKRFGSLLAPYLRDPDNVFVVSSDFCHWGSRFGYTAYAPNGDVASLAALSHKSRWPPDLPIHESIRLVDQLTMDAIAGGHHDDFVDNLSKTQNTVCGRHPIGVTMAALEILAQDAGAGADAAGDKYRFKFVQYQRSSLAQKFSDSSVSYASAYAIV